MQPVTVICSSNYLGNSFKKDRKYFKLITKLPDHLYIDGKLSDYTGQPREWELFCPDPILLKKILKILMEDEIIVCDCSGIIGHSRKCMVSQTFAKAEANA